MPVLSRPAEPTLRAGDAAFTPLVTPHAGGGETLVCSIEVTPGEPGMTHQVTRQQVYVALRGEAVAYLDGDPHHVSAGQMLVVPPNVPFALQGAGESTFEAILCAPVGIEVITTSGQFPPPWASTSA